MGTNDISNEPTYDKNNARPRAELGLTTDITMTGRSLTISPDYRKYVARKLDRLGKYSRQPVHYDVELSREKNPRQSKLGQRVTINSWTDGSIVRAESNGPDFYTAFDTAIHKLRERLLRGQFRLRVHHGGPPHPSPETGDS